MSENIFASGPTPNSVRSSTSTNPRYSSILIASSGQDLCRFPAAFLKGWGNGIELDCGLVVGVPHLKNVGARCLADTTTKAEFSIYNRFHIHFPSTANRQQLDQITSRAVQRDKRVPAALSVRMVVQFDFVFGSGISVQLLNRMLVRVL